MESFIHFTGLYLALYMSLLQICIGIDLNELKPCNKQPLESNTAPLPADNRFVIDIEGLDDKYIPRKQYKVRLRSIDGKSTFIGFTIFITGDTTPNENNPRKPDPLNPGQLTSIAKGDVSSDTIYKPGCRNAVFQSNITPKTIVEAMWTAPQKDQKCVTINAFVAVKPDVWYSNDGPLSKRVCEDQRKLDDMPPEENPNCDVCEEARYELRFEGKWSYNTHPTMYPPETVTAKFSDVVGASHGKSFDIFKTNSVASNGLKVLAEQGNTTELEKEILVQLGTNVRTIVKATGPPKPDMTTIASFRASRYQHYLSLVSAIIPSPDWFLGVSNMELCDIDGWAKTRILNLYPMDAGTDSGLNFDSSNDETLPAQPIAQAQIQRDPKESVKPFARLEVFLVRTYSTPNCVTATPQTDTYGGGDSGSQENYEPAPENTSETPVKTDSSVKDCPLTTWEEWLPCEAPCVDGSRSGYHSRFRYFIVDGVVVRNDDDSEGNDREVSEYCSENYSLTEIDSCEEPCEEDTTTAAPEEAESQRRMMWKDIKPGQGWGK